MREICDYMIIQRDLNGIGHAKFSGTFEPQENSYIIARVCSEYDNTMIVPWQKCKTEGNKWETDLNIPTGGLYRIEARHSAGEFSLYNNNDWTEYIKIVYHVGVGDIFVMAGQSNMSGYGKDPAYDPPQLGVHLFNKACEWVQAAHPMFSVTNPVYPNNDGSSCVSPGLSFGKTMQNMLHIPIGLVSVAQGGSQLELWNPSHDDPYLYNAMKGMLEQVGDFAGMIWYQGCSDCNSEEAPIYYDKFCETVKLWREQFGDFPIVTCQINRHAWRGEDTNVFWGTVREAQRRAAIDLNRVYIVPTADMPTVDGIHNTSAASIAVGERIANALLNAEYGFAGYQAPNIRKITKFTDSEIFIEFFEKHMLRTMDDNACGMNIEDEEGIMDCESVRVSDGGLIVKGKRNINGKALFHAYWLKEEPPFFVRDIYGMPMLSCYGTPVE